MCRVCLSLKVNEVLAVLEKRDEVYLYLLSDFVNVCQRGVFFGGGGVFDPCGKISGGLCM